MFIKRPRLGRVVWRCGLKDEHGFGDWRWVIGEAVASRDQDNSSKV